MRIWATCTWRRNVYFSALNDGSKIQIFCGSTVVAVQVAQKVTKRTTDSDKNTFIFFGAWKWWLRRAMETLTAQHSSRALKSKTTWYLFLSECCLFHLAKQKNTLTCWRVLQIVEQNSRGDGDIFTRFSLDSKGNENMVFFLGLGHGVFAGKKTVNQLIICFSLSHAFSCVTLVKVQHGYVYNS